jgi:hypothetical protein
MHQLTINRPITGNTFTKSHFHHKEYSFGAWMQLQITEYPNYISIIFAFGGNGFGAEINPPTTLNLADAITQIKGLLTKYASIPLQMRLDVAEFLKTLTAK